MDDIDGTGHYERASEVTPPSILAIVLDTNPYAWSSLAQRLPLSKAVADLLVFINAHLAFNHANKVAVIASHCGRTAWLYPSPSPADEALGGNDGSDTKGASSTAPANPNKYRPFALIEHELLRNLQLLFSTTKPEDLAASSTNTMLSGALTLALSYINKTLVTLPGSNSGPSTASNAAPAGLGAGGKSGGGQHQSPKMTSRILVVSVSGDLAGQYIPIMNVIFAAQHSSIPIDILKLAGDSVLLQQASYTTSGIFLSPTALFNSKNSDLDLVSNDHGTIESSSPQSQQEWKQDSRQISILATLLFAFLPDTTARQHLIPPTGVNVDFRAACFCHRRVVDIGFVCSICLSIFCDEGVVLGIQGGNDAKGASGGTQAEPSSALATIESTGACLTCGTVLNLRAMTGNGGAGSLLLNEQPKAKKKKKKRREGVDAQPT